jgi:hypothetical protein
VWNKEHNNKLDAATSFFLSLNSGSVHWLRKEKSDQSCRAAELLISVFELPKFSTLLIAQGGQRLRAQTQGIDE